MPRLEQLENSIAALHEKLKQLIIRISALSDDVLLEQAADEYNLLEEQIRNREDEYRHEQLVDMKLSHVEYYDRQFRPEQDLITALELTNKNNFEPGDIHNIIKDKCLRPPNNIKDRRGLLLLCRELSASISIKDYEGHVVDTLIPPKIEIIQQLFIYVNIYSSQSYESTPVEQLTPVVLRTE